MAKAEKGRVDAGEEKKYHFDFAGKFFEESEKEYFECCIKENKLEEYITYHGIVGVLQIKVNRFCRKSPKNTRQIAE